MLFKESGTGLHFQTNKRMTQTPGMISGVFLGTILIVITFKEGSFPRDREDLIAEKVLNSWSHYNLVRKPVSTLQAMKIPDAKAAVDKEWEKLEKLLAWQLTKVKNKKEVIGKAQKEGKTVPRCHIDGSLSLQELGYTGRVVLRGDVVKERLWILRCVHRAGIVSITNDGRKSSGHYCQTARMRWTGKRRSIRQRPCQNGRRSNIVETSQV